MSEAKVLQDEEREALCSIYEGDTAYKELDPKKFQYKYGKDDDNKSFLIEILWGENYPLEPPIINMDTFYNRNLIAPVKEKIIGTLNEEAQQWLGCGMTYTLFECLKERIEELVSEQPDTPVPTTAAMDLASNVEALVISIDANSNTASAGRGAAVKKEQLTKSQKRRQWERTDHKGDRPRGWNWVDVVKHLSQTGSHPSSTTSSTGAFA